MTASVTVRAGARLAKAAVLIVLIDSVLIDPGAIMKVGVRKIGTVNEKDKNC
jgi:hypothetical protein